MADVPLPLGFRTVPGLTYQLASRVSQLKLSTESTNNSSPCYDRRSAGQSLLVSSPIWGPRPDFCYCQTAAGLLMWCNWCWPSPAQSFSGPSPTGLMTIFYCPRFETPPTWRDRSPYLYPPAIGCRSYTPSELLVHAIYSLGTDLTENVFHYWMFSRCRGNNVSTELLLGDGSTCVLLYCRTCR
jgi:hypothetical protein